MNGAPPQPIGYHKIILLIVFGLRAWLTHNADALRNYDIIVFFGGLEEHFSSTQSDPFWANGKQGE